MGDEVLNISKYSRSFVVVVAAVAVVAVVAVVVVVCYFVWN